MPEQYDNNMTGIISKNDRRTQETHSHYKGKCEINNQEYYIDGWINERRDGSGTFMKLRFKAVSQDSSMTEKIETPTLSQGEDDDILPF